MGGVYLLFGIRAAIITCTVLLVPHFRRRGMGRCGAYWAVGVGGGVAWESLLAIVSSVELPVTLDGGL